MSKGMEQRNKAASITASDTIQKKALREFKKQLRRWKLVMPPHEPLVLDFGLDNFDSVGLIEYWIANEIEAGYCGKYLFVFDGQTCPMHSHKTKHETFFLVQGKLHVQFNGQRLLMLPGDCLPVPPRTPHSFTGRGPALLLEISKPCLVADNLFENPDIPIGGNYKKRP